MKPSEMHSLTNQIKPRLSHLLRCYYSSRNTLNDTEIPITLRGEADDPLYTNIPKPCRKKSERKPFPTPISVLIRRAKKEKELRKANPCRMLEHPPDNGLLVPQLVDVAHRVFWAKESLLLGISKLLKFVPVLRCRLCSEVHIGPVGHEIRTCTGPNSGVRSAMHVWRKGSVKDVIFFPRCFHIYDRVVKPRVTHEERFEIPLLPAIIELCVQAGLDLDTYPAKRRTKPVYCIDGRVTDFNSSSETDSEQGDNDSSGGGCIVESITDDVCPMNSDRQGTRADNFLHPLVLLDPEDGKRLKDISTGTMESYFEMLSGTQKLTKKYRVWTCGYCSEVQVGVKGHKVRNCKASKHQSRDGMHAWQEARIDDFVGPNYVWHVRSDNTCAGGGELGNSRAKMPLDNELKRWYGKAPAIIELCVQCGGDVPEEYRSMMRLDVVVPDRDEVDLVA